MGLWVVEGNVGGDDECAVLVDSVTERPLNLPCFEDRQDAESFVEFAREEDGVDDVRRLSDEDLDDLHTRWLGKKLRQTEREIPLSARPRAT